MKYKTYGCIVIGAGHAGIEAALASARMDHKTLLMTMDASRIGEMSCNPAIGGVGKGQLVKEIDILGGEMARTADKTAIQFRQLNASKGQAVRSSRCQSARKRYKLCMQKVIKAQANLNVLEDLAAEILVEDKKVVALKTESAKIIKTKTIVICPGTFLNGRIHIGRKITPAGRIGEPASVRLARSLEENGFVLMNFKTGTPPRLEGKTIDFRKMEIQHSDKPPIPFSFFTKKIPTSQKLIPCYITYTNRKTHEIIKAHMDQSPMYAGQMIATGVRYCPSIEDKLKKFSDKSRHAVFLEPEGLNNSIFYPNGISTGLPAEVQEKFVHTISGLENVKITRYGYAIEHAAIDARELEHTLESKRIRGLYFAGQINGTTGYEEAAAQGLVAGVNAALSIEGKDPFVLSRDEAYIGVLIDDLVTKGTQEPYRMFTSRVEYRLIIREDNADKRLARYGYAFGLLSRSHYERINKKYAAIEKEIQHLKETKVCPGTILDDQLKEIHSPPLKVPTSLCKILRRPGITYEMIAPLDGNLRKLPREYIDCVEYEIKYEGFIDKQRRDVEKFRHIDHIQIPEGFDYQKVQGLSSEIKEKLKAFAPRSLAQALRISGVTPAAISILMVYLKKQSLERKSENEDRRQHY